MYSTIFEIIDYFANVGKDLNFSILVISKTFHILNLNVSFISCLREAYHDM